MDRQEDAEGVGQVEGRWRVASEGGVLSGLFLFSRVVVTRPVSRRSVRQGRHYQRQLLCLLRQQGMRSDAPSAIAVGTCPRQTSAFIGGGRSAAERLRQNFRALSGDLIESEFLVSCLIAALVERSAARRTACAKGLSGTFLRWSACLEQVVGQAKTKRRTGQDRDHQEVAIRPESVGRPCARKSDQNDAALKIEKELLLHPCSGPRKPQPLTAPKGA